MERARSRGRLFFRLHRQEPPRRQSLAIEARDAELGSLFERDDRERDVEHDEVQQRVEQRPREPEDAVLGYSPMSLFLANNHASLISPRSRLIGVSRGRG